MDTSVKRGDIYYADLSPVVGSEQGGVRPVLIIQNDTGNRLASGLGGRRRLRWLRFGGKRRKTSQQTSCDVKSQMSDEA